MSNVKYLGMRTYSFSTAISKYYHKFSSLKQCTFIILQFPRTPAILSGLFARLPSTCPPELDSILEIWLKKAIFHVYVIDGGNEFFRVAVGSYFLAGYWQEATLNSQSPVSVSCLLFPQTQLFDSSRQQGKVSLHNGHYNIT